MSLKIICLEEHIKDATLADAASPLLVESVPYLAGLGSRLDEDPSREPSDRPRLQGPHRAEALAATPIDQRLADMDRDAIDTQVLSSTQAIQLLPADQAIDLARRANDRLAETVARHPGRFAAFAALPWQDPDAAARELVRAVTDLGLVGSLLSGRPGPTAMIDHPAYAPVLAAHEAVEVPLYLHPGPPLPAVQHPYYAGFGAEVTSRVSLYGWGWHNEAGVAVIRLILSGALDRCPGLRLISGHWGEMVPFFLQRLDDALPREATGLRRTVGQTYRDHVFVTPSGMLTLPQFTFIQTVLGAERILFAVDYPYLTQTGARAWLEALPITEEERAAIAHGNAERLLHLQP